MNTPMISVEELQKRLEEGKETFILDVRPKEQRNEWQIAGSHYVDAYEALNKGDRSVLDGIDAVTQVPIVTVCAAGRTSQVAADILREKGYNASSLQGGMKAWNYAWNTAEIGEKDYTIIQVRRVAKGCLSYIVGSNDTAIVIDASLDPQVYTELAAAHGWAIQYVTDTHIHADYISRTIDLAKTTGADHLFTGQADVAYPFTPFKDGQIISFGQVKFQVLYTPGHTPESLSFLVSDKYLLTGDTLFTDGVGRPDLKVDKEQAIRKAKLLYASLQKLKSLENDPTVLPAHTSTAIDFDKKVIGERLSILSQRITLLKLSESQFIEQTIQRIPPTPPNYQQIAAINKSGNHEGVNFADLEAGANRCAVS